jgi:O-antigen/teichoic acid export membrane protein
VTTAWCIVLVLQVARSGASVLLQALKDFRFLTLANLWTAAAAVAAATLLAAEYGVLGAISGTAVGEMLLGLVLWRKISRNGSH